MPNAGKMDESSLELELYFNKYRMITTVGHIMNGSDAATIWPSGNLFHFSDFAARGAHGKYTSRYGDDNIIKVVPVQPSRVSRVLESPH